LNGFNVQIVGRLVLKKCGVICEYFHLE
jgi:predicted choloylglycine hydrolase